MIRVAQALFLAVLSIGMVHGALRARYTFPSQHLFAKEVAILDTAVFDSVKLAHTPAYADSLVEAKDPLVYKGADTVPGFGSVYASPEKNNAGWQAALAEGVWEDYNTDQGFDGAAANALGDTTHIPDWILDSSTIVDGMFWVDSLSTNTTSAPYIWQYEADTSVGLGGYFVMFYGQINIPETGDYDLLTAGRYEGLKVWIDVDKDNVFNNSTETNWHNTVDKDSILDSTLFYDGFNGSVLRHWKLNIPQGKYRFMAHYWHWGNENSGPTFGWKIPGADSAVNVPASAFGARKAVPVPDIKMVAQLVDGDSARVEDNRICEPKTVSYVVNVENASPDSTITYYWRFQDTTIVTDKDTVSYLPSRTGNIRPFVRAAVGTQPTREQRGYIYTVKGVGCKPSASITEGTLNGAALGASGQVELCDGAEALVKYAAQAGDIPAGLELTYTWKIGGETIENTSTSLTDTISATFNTVGTIQPEVTIAWNGSSSDKATYSHPVNLIECSVGLLAGLESQPFLTIEGTRLLLNLSGIDGARVSIHRIDGTRSQAHNFNRAARVAVMDLSALPTGLYWAHVEKDGKAYRTARIFVP